MQFGDTIAYKKFKGSIPSHTDTLPYRHLSSDHVYEPSKVPPYNGSTLVQANHGASHQVRPSHNPTIITRVVPPPLNARKSSVGPHESISAPHNSMRPLPPKPNYIRGAADTSIDPNKPSLFVPSVSASTVSAPATVSGHIPAQQPRMITYTQGITTAPITVDLASMVALPQLLQLQLHAGVVSAPLPGSIGMMPPLPPGPSPSSSSQAGVTSLLTGTAQLPGAAPDAYRGLLSTLVAQGLITMKPQQAPSQVLLTGLNISFIQSAHVSKDIFSCPKF
jgi:hypothetical protein